MPYLIEIGLQEVNLLGGLQQTRPELFLQLLLAQDQLDFAVTVVDLGVLGVDFGEQLERDVVLNALLGVSSESDTGGLDVESRIGTGNIGSLDVDVQVVALGIRSRRALGPCDWWINSVSISS